MKIMTLQHVFDEKANANHVYEFVDIYKTVVEEINGIKIKTAKSL